MHFDLDLGNWWWWMGGIRTIVMFPLGSSCFSLLCCHSQLAVPVLVFDLTASVARIANKDGECLAMQWEYSRCQLAIALAISTDQVYCGVPERIVIYFVCMQLRKRCCCMPPSFLNFVDSSCLHAEGRKRHFLKSHWIYHPIIATGTAVLQQQHQKRYHWILKASTQSTLTHMIISLH